MIEAKPTHLTVAEYCARMASKVITVNKDYQRGDRVWPEAARSFLIESILLGFPIPKFYHHSITNVKTRRTAYQIIDGQQRSAAIFDYFNDKFALSNKLETESVMGRRYSELDEEWQGRFLNYLLSIDLFLGIEGAQVRQIFRRMNAFTVPLNPEEMRHATFQGEFKWFIAAKAQDYQELLTSFRILSEKAVFRMLDLKLLTEVVHAFDQGIKTTNKSILDGLYAKYDTVFSEEPEYSRMLDFAFDTMTDLEALNNSNLSRPYIVYSLAAALGHQLRAVPGLEEHPKQGQAIDIEKLNRNLLIMSEVLDMDEDEIKKSPFRSFITASVEKTNVKSQRETRARWFLRALRENFEDL